VTGENRIMRSDQGNEDHMDMACSTHGREEKRIKCLWESLKGGVH
jgi:hypothetical protein